MAINAERLIFGPEVVGDGDAGRGRDRAERRRDVRRDDRDARRGAELGQHIGQNCRNCAAAGR